MTASTYRSGDDRVELVIRPEHRRWKALLRIAMLAFAALNGPAIVGAVVANPPNGIAARMFVLAWLLFGAALVALVMIDLLWVSFGAQRVSIEGDELTVKRSIGPVVIGRPKTFDGARVQNMRVEERHFEVRGNSAIEHMITFEYLGERRPLLRKLSEDAAYTLMAGTLRRFARSSP